MSKAKVGQRWGRVDFSKDKFKSGDYKVRASMAFSMLNQEKSFTGKTIPTIREELGDPDGFYFTDMYPAYLIDLKEDDSWQIVFLLDRNYKVSELILHKNCCDK